MVALLMLSTLLHQGKWVYEFISNLTDVLIAHACQHNVYFILDFKAAMSCSNNHRLVAALVPGGYGWHC